MAGSGEQLLLAQREIRRLRSICGPVALHEPSLNGGPFCGRTCRATLRLERLVLIVDGGPSHPRQALRRMRVEHHDRIGGHERPA
jgi:hypothetical protein